MLCNGCKDPMGFECRSHHLRKCCGHRSVHLFETPETPCSEVSASRMKFSLSDAEVKLIKCCSCGSETLKQEEQIQRPGMTQHKSSCLSYSRDSACYRWMISSFVLAKQIWKHVCKMWVNLFHVMKQFCVIHIFCSELCELFLTNKVFL